MARRLDRRVLRTRKLLREAMMDLIMEEGYDAISIQDITDKANLGRATFYLHFKDKDELLLEVMQEFLTDFLEQVPQLTEAQWRLDDSKALTRLFDFAAEHYDLYRILIIGSGGITAARQLQHNVAKNIQTYIETEVAEQHSTPVVPVDFIANHFSGSLLATIYWWLDSDLPYTAEEMAEMFQKVNQLERKTLMGQEEPLPEPEDEKDRKKAHSKDKPAPKKNKPDPKTVAVSVPTDAPEEKPKPARKSNPKTTPEEPTEDRGE